jgi:cell division protein FtsW
MTGSSTGSPALGIDIAAHSPPSGRFRSDPILFTVILLLTALGVVMVYSSSAIFAQQRFSDSHHFLVRDLVWITLGFVAMAITMRLDYRFYARVANPLLAVAFVLLCAVLLVGARRNGAQRWFSLAGFSFQPAELGKLAIVVFLAHTLSRKRDKVDDFLRGFVPPMGVCGVFMLLLLKQPDLGTAVIMGGVTMVLLFLAGTKLTYLLSAMLVALPILYLKIVDTPWRLRRILAYLDPWQFRSNYGYQMAASLIAIGSGGVFGQGLGDSKQKLFLPEAYTDYILAIIGEELGFSGILLVLLLFAVLLYRGFRAAVRAQDLFGYYLASGITTMLALQAIVNAGVVLGVLPTKGLPLPLVSFGGSTLVIDLAALGILLNVSRAEPAPTPVRTARRRSQGGRPLFGWLWNSNRKRMARRRPERSRTTMAPAGSRS